MEPIGAPQRFVGIVARHWRTRAAAFLGDPKPATFRAFLLPNENPNADLPPCPKTRTAHWFLAYVTLHKRLGFTS